MASSLGGLGSETISYSDLSVDLVTLRSTVSQLEKAVEVGIVTKANLLYIIRSLIQAGRFSPDSREMAVIENFYLDTYRQHLPEDIKYAGAREP
ncbi:hypothetical protein CMO83_04860 [Candidatus Woesearchaeota archaeon]|jgi:hypothetical protein|nr:hypothetical protein [Candidatus Woesearchaeota archaeon]MDP6648203.1 hypothetical protein [Candidatus Woesearchaeota archaeon]|tara:strand:+ start:39834 stop:40115 length:282 start_codon:yes stop_codon:yes gene_type:complete